MFSDLKGRFRQSRPEAWAPIGRFRQPRPEAWAPIGFGYCVLGRVIEKASGRAYIDYVRDEVLAPLGITRVALGRTLPTDRATEG